MAAEPHCRLLSPRLWLAALLMLLAAPLQAQVQRWLTASARDSIRADSLRADSVARRQAIQTERYLDATCQERHVGPAAPVHRR